MTCPEKVLLIREYSACIGAYRDAVEQLLERVHDDMDSYLRLAQEAEKARLICEQSRLAVQQHFLDHKC